MCFSRPLSIHNDSLLSQLAYDQPVVMIDKSYLKQDVFYCNFCSIRQISYQGGDFHSACLELYVLHPVHATQFSSLVRLHGQVQIMASQEAALEILSSFQHNVFCLL